MLDDKLEGINLDIKSVAYLKSDDDGQQDTQYCAILFTMTFKSKKPLDSVSVLLKLELVADADDDAKKRVISIPFYFPTKEERVPTAEIKENKGHKVTFDPGVDVGGIGGHLGQVSIHKNTEEVKKVFVVRTGSRPEKTQQDPSPKLEWAFERDGADFYPSVHTFIVLVSCKPRQIPPPFKIRFLIGKKKTFPFLFNPRECTFRGHYNPKEVDHYLRVYKEQKLEAREFADITLKKLADY